jgi:hypothetical protein
MICKQCGRDADLHSEALLIAHGTYSGGGAIKVKTIDTQQMDLATAKSMVEDLLPSLEPKVVMALYVVADADETLFEMLEVEAYKVAGHEEEVPDA